MTVSSGQHPKPGNNTYGNDTMPRNTIATATINQYRATYLQHAPHRYAIMQPADADRKYNDYSGNISNQQLADHLNGTHAYAVPMVANDLAHLLALDIDAGGIEAASELLAAAAERGIRAYGQIDPHRGRGYVYAVFDQLVNAARIHELAEQIIAASTQRPAASAYRIENRTHGADTRLPFARHRWSNTRGILLRQDGSTVDLDNPTSYYDTLDNILNQPANSTDLLPPPPAASAERPTSNKQRSATSGHDISSYNHAHDLADVLAAYGARPARGRGQSLYFCPFHCDNHASLLITRDGQRCKCLSTSSGCPLAGKWHDSFNVFCVGEQIDTTTALRRINDLPDRPRSEWRPTSSPQPVEAHEQPASGPQQPASSPQPPEAHERPTSSPQQPAASGEPRTSAATAERLPKTCKRLLDFIARARTYRRGIGHLARLLDCDERTIRRSLRRLEALGHVQRHERGRDGQTDIYTYQPAGGGGHLSPTVNIRSLPATELDQAERGGSGQPAAARPPAAASNDQQPAARSPQPAEAIGPEGEQYGPDGAVAYPDGAAYIPTPAAEVWYSAITQSAAATSTPATGQSAAASLTPATGQSAAAHEQPATTGGPRAAHQQPPAAPSSPRAARNQRRRKPAASIDDLKRRIYAAEARAKRLASGTKQDKRQATAIRHAAERLRRELAYLLETPEEPEEPQQLPFSSQSVAATGQPVSDQPAAATAPPLGYDVAGMIRRLQERNHGRRSPHTAARC